MWIGCIETGEGVIVFIDGVYVKFVLADLFSFSLKYKRWVDFNYLA